MAKCCTPPKHVHILFDQSGNLCAQAQRYRSLYETWTTPVSPPMELGFGTDRAGSFSLRPPACTNRNSGVINRPMEGWYGAFGGLPFRSIRLLSQPSILAN